MLNFLKAVNWVSYRAQCFSLIILCVGGEVWLPSLNRDGKICFSSQTKHIFSAYLNNICDRELEAV